MDAKDAVKLALDSRLAELRTLTEAGKPLSKYTSSKGHAKGWVLPNKKFVSIPGWHFDYLLENVEELKKKFGVDFSRFTRESGEQEVRLYALKHGFIRVNYEHNTGTLTVEANNKFWDKKAKDCIFMLVADNEDSIDNMLTTLLDDKGKVVNSRFSRLFTYDGREKFDHLPLITDSSHNAVLRAVLESDGFPVALHYPSRAAILDQKRKSKPTKKTKK